MSGKKILITGGCGFIGQHLAKKLIEQGNSIELLDIRPPDFSSAQMRYIKGDVRDGAIAGKCVAGCDMVIHAAAIVGVEAYVRQPDEVIDVNVSGSKIILDACLRYAKPVLLTSTSEIYGNNGLDLDEEASGVYGPPSQARWCYAVSKAACEHLAFGLGAKGLRFVITRYFNVYGPGMTAQGGGRVLYRFIKALRGGLPVPLVDGGDAVRCFCYITDAVDATLGLLEALGSGKREVIRRAFNIGHVEPVSMRELAQRLVRLTGHAAGVADVEGRAVFGRGYQDIERRVPDVTAIRDAIGFQAGISLDDGLLKTLEAEGLPVAREAAVRPPPVIPWVRPHFSVNDALLQNLRKLLQSGRVTNDGPAVAAFEREAARYLGVADTIAVSSGSHALLLSARALGCKGSAVLPSFSFISTLSALVHAGLKPVFCDVDPGRWTLSPDHLATLARENNDVSLVVPVNSYGVPPDMAAILSAASRTGLKVLYDDAHGFGSEIQGLRNYPGVDIRIISLHATKSLPAVEGGLIICADKDTAGRIRQMRSHGLALPRESSMPGVNCRMDELRATIASNSLLNFDRLLRQRSGYALRLRAHMERRCGNFFILQQLPGNATSNHTNLAVLVPAAATAGIQPVIEMFASFGVETRRYFYPPLHKLEYLGNKNHAGLPVTDRLFETLLCLPLHSNMTELELERIERALTGVAGMQDK